MKVTKIIVAASSVVLTIAAAGAYAQSPFPSRPITLIYPFPGGSPGDVGMRAIAAESAKTLGQPMIVENRPGGSGIAGINAMKTGQADGHTLSFMNVGNLVVRPAADSSFQFEVGRDYQPVLVVWETFDYVYAHPSAPFKDMRSLIAYAKANPGKLDAAYAGAGGSGHTSMEFLLSATGIQVTQIPYKGAADLIAATMGGQVPVMFIGQKLQSQVESGKLLALAYSGPSRNPEFPTVPTIMESGVPGYSTVGNWVAVLAPAATPRDVVQKLNVAMNGALKVPEVRARIEANGAVVGGSAEQAATRIRTGLDQHGPTLRKLGLKFE